MRQEMASPPQLSDAFNEAARLAVAEEMKHGKAPDTLRRHYEECLRQAEADGVPRENVCATVKKRLNTLKARKVRLSRPEAAPEECMIAPTWFHSVAAELGYTNLKFSPVAQEVPQPEAQTSSGQEANNKNFYEICMRTSEIAEKCAEKIRKYEQMDEDKAITEIISQWHARLSAITELLDARRLIQTDSQLLFLHLCETTTSLDAALTLYFKHRVDARINAAKKDGRAIMTAKQATKIGRQEIRDLSAALQPRGRDDALTRGYTGQQCSECASWRVRPDHAAMHSGECLQCGLVEPIISVKQCAVCHALMWDTRLAEMKKTGKCPMCGVPADIPSTARSQPSFSSDDDDGGEAI